MAADTYTPILNLLLQGTGNNSNSWGTNLNNSVITPLENAVKGCLTISGLVGGAYTLTQANALYGTIKLQGTLASDLTITVPSTANNWRFINELVTAGFYVLIKVAAQTAANIPHGKVTEISCDGTNMYRHDRESVGELFYFAGTTVPGGAIECTGATPLRASALDLFGKVGTTWGVGNGTTTFTIPDAYTAGKFLRSRTAAVAIGTAQANANKAHTHTVSGTTDSGGVDHTHTQQGTFASGNMSANASHTHVYNKVSGTTYQYYQGGSQGSQPDTNGVTGSTSTEHTHNTTISGATTGASAYNHTHTYTGTAASDGGTEARPENISAMLCIRY
jgi:hypothetical protein